MECWKTTNSFKGPVPKQSIELWTLLHELGVSQPQEDIRLCDNIGAIYLSTNLMFHDRTKHIEVNYHFVK